MKTRLLFLVGLLVSGTAAWAQQSIPPRGEFPASLANSPGAQWNGTLGTAVVQTAGGPMRLAILVTDEGRVFNLGGALAPGVGLSAQPIYFFLDSAPNGLAHTQGEKIIVRGAIENNDGGIVIKGQRIPKLKLYAAVIKQH